MTYKTVTHWLALGVTALAAFALTPAGQALIAQYPKLSIFFGFVGGVAALYHDPKTVK